MTPLDQFLKEAREKRESVTKYHPKPLEFERIDHEPDTIAYEHNYDGRFIPLYDHHFTPKMSAKWHASYFEFACNNQERFEKLVRVAVEKFQLIKEGARFTDPKTTNNNGIAMLSAMQIEQLASDALIQMNEIAGEK